LRDDRKPSIDFFRNDMGNEQKSHRPKAGGFFCHKIMEGAVFETANDSLVSEKLLK